MYEGFCGERPSRIFNPASISKKVRCLKKREYSQNRETGGQGTAVAAVPIELFCIVPGAAETSNTNSPCAFGGGQSNKRHQHARSAGVAWHPCAWNHHHRLSAKVPDTRGIAIRRANNAEPRRPYKDQNRRMPNPSCQLANNPLRMYNFSRSATSTTASSREL
ncbi:hypothetical protein DL89DRAFT_139906 [Linderina pennispora]|uniref:Uncharacterized protein n=1 Tax=Linderina pennispora TaxID=61395 RepID=A0A1Y1WB52_9FUNG|nr:uncharacterized protein DL89DRAFT_139906 [Linderina pennispora]ORX70767.1 hypothetical protein DL89DRAFT_139906 [Linderina pennispora]